MNDAGTLSRHMLDVRELTPEAFAPYGQVIAPLRTGGQGAETRYAPRRMLLRNAWYIGAWADELADKPLARRICGDPVVLFRDGAGKAAALADRCCHRAARCISAASSRPASSAAITAWCSTAPGNASPSPGKG